MSAVAETPQIVLDMVGNPKTGFVVMGLIIIQSFPNLRYRMRKPIFKVSDQVRRKLGYTTTEDG